jgi:hypothetical protein
MVYLGKRVDDLKKGSSPVVFHKRFPASGYKPDIPLGSRHGRLRHPDVESIWKYRPVNPYVHIV